MLLDVSVQANSLDYRALDTPVTLTPQVTAVRFNKPETGEATVVRGSRAQSSNQLRWAGYLVVWSDENPAVALGSRSSLHKAATARSNGALSQGRPRSQARVCPEPLKTTLERLDKGTLIDLVYVAFKDDSGCLKTVLSTALQARQAVEGKEATP